MREDLFHPCCRGLLRLKLTNKGEPIKEIGLLNPGLRGLVVGCSTPSWATKLLFSIA